MWLTETTMKSVLAFTVCIILVTEKCVAAPAPINVGATLPLTGFGATWGSEALQGLQMAADEVNASGGISGRPLRIIPEDFGQFDLKRAATAANKFVSADGVSAILTMWSEDTEAVWPIAQAHSIPVLSIAAGKKDVTNGRSFLARVWPSDEHLIEAELVCAKNSGSSKAAIIYNLPTMKVSPTLLLRDGRGNLEMTR
jgi:branched-chain amino acid transport system substrate-binding protein